MPHSVHQEQAGARLQRTRALVPDHALSDSDVLELARALIPKYMHPQYSGQVPDASAHQSALTADMVLALMAVRARKAEQS